MISAAVWRKTIVHTGLKLVCLWLCAAGAVRGDEQAIVFQSTDTPPYWTPTLPNDGLGGSVLKLLSENAKVKYSINYLPTQRFRESDSTFILGDPDFLINQKPRAIFPIGIFEIAFFYYKPQHESLVLHGFQDLNGLTLGVLHGTMEDKDFFVRNGIKIEETSSPESLIRMLRSGRIDLCILVAGSGQETIRKLFPDEQDSFALSIIPKLTRPLAIIIDLDKPEGRSIAERYRLVLNSTLRSEKYLDILREYYRSQSIPPDSSYHLERFLKQYASTWKH